MVKRKILKNIFNFSKKKLIFLIVLMTTKILNFLNKFFFLNSKIFYKIKLENKNFKNFDKN